MYQNFAIIAVLIFIYSLVAGKIEKGPISGPIVFLLAGLILGYGALNILDIPNDKEAFKTLAEIALAMVLFTDASKTNLTVIQNNLSLPVKLLFIGLPITIILGAIVATFIFPEFTWIEAAILATVLAPTDAALGEPVVNNKAVPSKVREGINIESGLNDGICVPILFFLIMLYSLNSIKDISAGYGALLLVKEIGIGLLVGVGLAFLGDLLIKTGLRNMWVESAWKPTIIITLAISCFALAQVLGGSGFIACFTGGLLFGKRFKENKLEMLNGAEGIGKILSSLIWLLFGAAVVSNLWIHLNWQIILYAFLSLTVLRILPVLLSLINSKLTPYQKIFTAWFGPRGLASIVFAVIVLDVHLPNESIINSTISLTILLSVFAHGFTAMPMAHIFSRKPKEELQPK